MSLADELQKLQQLRDSGSIDDDEFASAKAKLLAGSGSSSGSSEPMVLSGDEADRMTRQWALILHLSQFAGYVVPVAGFIVPVVIWQLKKDELPLIDVHGKNCVNWIISKIIYLVISVVLCFIIIGFAMLAGLSICIILFPILAAVKANNGEVWKYPGAIPFFK